VDDGLFLTMLRVGDGFFDLVHKLSWDSGHVLLWRIAFSRLDLFTVSISRSRKNPPVEIMPL
jgi:hypothetical protein